MSYIFSIEGLETTYQEHEHIYRKHYAEMQERLLKEGVSLPEYNPRLDIYFSQNNSGGLVHYKIRCDGVPVGHSNIYIFESMHNRMRMASEDTIYVLPEHRNGVGRKFSKFILEDLKQRGVMQLQVTAMTDLRVVKLWTRMGFKPVATTMIYTF